MQLEDFTPPDVCLNGHNPPPAQADEWRQVEQAYHEIQRRDASAERQAGQWRGMVKMLIGLLVLTLGILVWQILRHRNVQAFVQVVQVSDNGKLVQVGVPSDLLAYTPEDGLWMDMLGEWVRRVRWRSTDTTLARAQWAWVYRHTCGQARRLVQAMEEREQPFKAGKKLVTVELKSVTKTPAPESYQVLWAETSTDQAQPTVKTTLWTGTFSVGRLKPSSLQDALENRMGLCVTAYDMSQQP